MIVLEGIGKSFDSDYAVRDLSLTVEKGEIFGLVGPNGAGKTTTLRMLTGLLTPDTGRVLIGGFDIAREPMKAKSLYGYVPDKPFLYEKLSVREFLIFTSSIHRVDKSTAMARIERLLELFSLSETGDELIEGLSQGMRQRLVFSSALLHDPLVLLIDEPFVGLDPFGVRMLKGLIRELGSQGKSIFLATHSLHIAEEVCDRIGFIKKGALLAVKSREELAAMEGGLEALFIRLGS